MGRWSQDTARACRAAAPAVALPTADALDAVAARAEGTPALVVTGPVSSGKSTLVNALVGRRVAPTGAGECTRLVARYVRGPVDRLDVVLADGTRRPLPLADGGRVPAAVRDRLGVDPADVDHLLVTLTSDALDGLTVVDTPGAGSARRRGPALPDDAEAALVVLPSSARADEVDRLAGAARHGPAGVVAVLGRADTVGSADDAATAATTLGHRLGARLGPVTPVVGLLAETATTGALRAEDRHALAALTGADPAAVDAALADPELFARADLPVGVPARMRLLELLDRRGITLAVGVLRERPEAGVGDIAAALLGASGLDRVVERLRTGVRERADLLAAAAGERRVAGLLDAERAAVRADRDAGRPTAAGARDLARLGDLLEDLRARPLHLELALAEAGARARSGAVELPEELAADLEVLAGAGVAAPDRSRLADLARRVGLADAGAGELAGHAARRAAAWRSYATWGTPPARSDVADAVHRGWARLWGELTG
ncbi:dynamin family protein [Actinomycetospora endophytica]|uniref:Dynamin family protein n=1 Tax=Actinomycetospora endophytica TaxID=2291215 RepID=A0ABS8P3Y9_9PSEU|nr:dynamin family protein [Actinomycetospora endophytica]MCD2192968.1 dynamin family protein [Actinomycetospora endophytica]